MVPITPDHDFTDDILVAVPYLVNGETNHVAISIVADTFPVTEVYLNEVDVSVSIWASIQTLPI